MEKVNLQYVRERLEKVSQDKVLSNMKMYIHEEDKNHVIDKADMLMNHTFTFDSVWDMEACDTAYTLQPMVWDSVCHNDEEWCFMLNRMGWQSDLILAGIISDDSKYFEKSLWYTMDWINSHEKMEFGLSTRTLDTGIRIMNIFETLPYLIQTPCISDDQLQSICEHIWKQIEYCKENYQYKYHLSNWGSIQICAIISILPYLTKDYLNHETFKWAYQELEEQLNLQIYPDGMLWEQSTMYHVEVLNYLMKLQYHANIHHLTLPSCFDNTVQRMLNGLMHQIGPDGYIDAFGDSDRVPARDVFVRGACLYKNGYWKKVAGKDMDVESLYMLGTSFCQTFFTQKDEDTVCWYDGVDSGMYTMRTNWQPDASFTLFTNGSLGSGHGHCDQMHISLSYKGLPFLIDSGRYTYRENHELRVKLKSMYAHNSIIIDQKEASKPNGSWTNEAYATPLKTYSKHLSNVHYLESTLISTNPLQVWTRKLCMINEGIWFLVDEIKQDGEHTFAQRFHFHPNVDVQQHSLTEIQMKNHNQRLTLKSKYPIRLEKDVCSLRYNQKSTQNVMVVEGNFLDEVNILQVFCDPTIQVLDSPIYQGGNKELDVSIAQAKTCILSKDESYTFVVFHKELYQGAKLCTCDGVNFHAKSLCIHTKDNKKEILKLKM